MAGINTYKIGAIGSGILTEGMKLAGIRYVYDTDTTEGVEKAIRELISKQDIGVIVITERLVGMIKDRKLLNLVDTSLLPMFIEVPGYNETDKYTDTLRRLITKAIGLDITKSR